MSEEMHPIDLHIAALKVSAAQDSAQAARADLWARFAAIAMEGAHAGASMPGGETCASHAAKAADALLAEYDKRFGEQA